MTILKVRVHRQKGQGRPHLQTYEVEVRPTQTVLDVLHEILYEQQSTLTIFEQWTLC